MADFFANIFSLIMGFYFSFGAVVHNTPQECGEYQDFEYCYYMGDSASHRRLYVFNGVGHDARGWGWNPIQHKIQNYWKNKSLRRPHVITIGKKGLWWYTDVTDGEKLNAFLDWFEAKHSLKAGSERFLYGDSMGGHNALRWGTDFPERFKAMALSCPAMPLSFAKSKTNFGSWGLSYLADALILSHYAQAKTNTTPIEQLTSKIHKSFIPRIHVVAASRDEFGFYPGSLELYKALKEHTSAEVSFEEYPSTHCYIEPTQLAEFLSK